MHARVRVHIRSELCHHRRFLCRAPTETRSTPIKNTSTRDRDDRTNAIFETFNAHEHSTAASRRVNRLIGFMSPTWRTTIRMLIHAHASMNDVDCFSHSFFSFPCFLTSLRRTTPGHVFRRAPCREQHRTEHVIRLCRSKSVTRVRGNPCNVEHSEFGNIRGFSNYHQTPTIGRVSTVNEKTSHENVAERCFGACLKCCYVLHRRDYYGEPPNVLVPARISSVLNYRHWWYSISVVRY